METRLSEGQQVAVATAETILEWYENGQEQYVNNHGDAVTIQVCDLECLLEIVELYHDAMDELDLL